MRCKFLLCAVLGVFALSTLSTASIAAGEIQNGGMDAFTSGAATSWTKYNYKSGSGNPKWESAVDRDGTSGSYSQKIFVADLNGAYAGLYQQIDAGIGDAITVTAWGGLAPNNRTGAQLGIDWAGGTAPVNLSSLGQMAWGQKTVAGNATSNKVTVFLHAFRSTSSGATTQYTFFDDVVSYHAYKPLAAAASNITASSLTLDLDAGLNNANAQYAIKVNGGAFATGDFWLQTDGTVGNAMAWLSDAQASNVTFTGFAAETSYSLQAKARYNSTWMQETALGDIGTFTTVQDQSAVPEPGSILAACSILAPAGLAFKRRRK